MKRKSTLLVALFLLLAATAATAAMANDPDGHEKVFPIGTKLDNFTMPDPLGAEHAYEELKGKTGTLIIFLSAQCPIVKMYDQRINEIAAAYKARGINFIGIYPNYTESVEWVREHSQANYKFPVLLDKNNVFADKLGATRTPEVYYFNAKDVLLYHGAIDNDRTGENISKTYLLTAFDETLAGKKITEQETRAFGCSIKRVKDKPVEKSETR